MMNLNHRTLRKYLPPLPPENPTDAGPALGSRLYEALPRITPVVTYVVCMVAIALFYLQNFTGEAIEAKEISLLNNDRSLQAEYNHSIGMRRYLEILSGDWWGLLGNAFYHGNFMHILFNLLMLFRFGSLIERGLGSMKTLGIVILLAGVSMAYQTCVSSYYPLYHLNLLPGGSAIGLSGIVYGMGGFIWAAWPRWTGFLEGFDLKIVHTLIFWQALCFILTWANIMHIANTAHISGLVMGIFLGQWACRGSKLGMKWVSLSIITITVAAVLLSICAMRITALKTFWGI